MIITLLVKLVMLNSDPLEFFRYLFPIKIYTVNESILSFLTKRHQSVRLFLAKNRLLHFENFVKLAVSEEPSVLFFAPES